MGNNIRDLQMVCLDILKEVDRVCKKHNILYWLEGGTMLGAVRHRGFIPWDDDLDIAMFRDDYNRFLKIAPQELKENYFLQTHETDSEYPLFFAKVRKDNTSIDSKPFRKLNMHKGIFVDIFPVDKISEKKFFQYVQYQRIKWGLLWNLFIEQKIQTKTTEIIFIKCLRRTVFQIFSMKKEFFHRRMEKILQRYNKKIKGPSWHSSFTAIPSMQWVYKKEWHDSFIEVEFEDMTARIPGGYHELLTHAYGDYMTPPPKEKQVPGHGVKFSIDTTDRKNKQ